MVRGFLAATAFCCILPTSARCQGIGAVLEGQIVDSISGEPIQGVLVRTDAGPEAYSDARGAFRLSGLPEGRRLLALLSADCRITWGQVDVVEGLPRQVRLRLPPAFGAVGESVRDQDRERRRGGGGGRRVEAEEIGRMQVKSTTEVLRRVAPNMVGPLAAMAGASSTIRSGRSRTFTDEDPPVVVVDGVRVHDPNSVLHELPASEVEVLEVLPGSVAGWEYGAAGAAGVIKITLKKGVPDGSPAARPVTECVVPDFPRR